MPEWELSTVKSLRRFLVENGEHVKMRRLPPERTELRRRLDERLLAFRLARKAAATDQKTAAETRSWLRAVRQAVGVPVEVMARRLGVNKYEVFRVEKAEWESRIVLGTLRRAADALGCGLIYALAPREGSAGEWRPGRRRSGSRRRRWRARRMQRRRGKLRSGSIGARRYGRCCAGRCGRWGYG